MPLLEDEDTSDDQKLELLRAPYAIMASFVDLGFSIDAEPCGQPQKDPGPSVKALRDHVYSANRNFNERFEDAAGLDASAPEKGVEA